MADVWVNSMACHPRATCHIAGCCYRANSTACHPSHVSHCRVLPLGEFTVMSPEPHATLQGVIIPSAIWKSFSAIFYFIFVFFSTVLALTSGGFRIVSNTLVRFIMILQMQENRPGCLYNGPNGCITQCIRPEFCQLKQHSSTSCISSAGIPVYAY